MHTLIACLSIVLAALSWAWSCRRVRAVERRLADAENRLTVAERMHGDEVAIRDGLHAGIVGRLDRIERRAVCRRPHAEDFARLVRPRSWRDDEEAFNLVR